MSRQLCMLWGIQRPKLPTGRTGTPDFDGPQSRTANATVAMALKLFLGLVRETWVEETLARVDAVPKSRADAMACLYITADKQRWEEPGLDQSDLENWANVAHGLQSLATHYEPSGKVGSIDVFHAVPLKAAAKSRMEWLKNHLSKWKDFCVTTPQFHEVGGAHYTMLGPDFVPEFAGSLMRALAARDV